MFSHSHYRAFCLLFLHSRHWLTHFQLPEAWQRFLYLFLCLSLFLYLFLDLFLRLFLFLFLFHRLSRLVLHLAKPGTRYKALYTLLLHGGLGTHRTILGSDISLPTCRACAEYFLFHLDLHCSCHHPSQQAKRSFHRLSVTLRSSLFLMTAAAGMHCSMCCS